MNEHWSEEELKASVTAYLEMYKKQANHIDFVKKHYYVELAKRFGRTEKAFAYRMQNISYVLSLMGRDWLSGLKPAKNVGSNNAAIIERLLAEVETQKFPQVAEFETEVSHYKAKKNLERPSGIKEPAKAYVSVTSFTRDAKVKAWVLQVAAGICECCNTPAPFVTDQGDPFLETHHLRRLADGGSDTPSNTVALCPNCHRELHYGANKQSLLHELYSNVSRLIREFD